MNRFSLLSKWLWWIATKKDALWRTVLKCKYGVTMGEGGGVWKKGEKGTAFFCGSIFAWGGNVLPAMTFSVGHGTNVCSWLDLWCGDILKDAFLDLYGISWDKEATLADHLCWRVPCYGMLFSCDLYMIGRWMHWPQSWISSIRQKLGGMLWIRFFENIQRVDYLR